LRGQHLGAFKVEVQDQDAGFTRPFVARVFADAIDKAQTARFKLGLELLLALLVLFRFQLLAEWVPGCDERGAVGISFGHQASEFGAGLADAHLEGGISVDEVFRLHERLDKFSG